MTRRLFADSWYYLAMLNPRDARHAEAKQFSQHRNDPVVTTRWVLTEVVDAFSQAINRSTVLGLIDALEQEDSVTIVPAEERGWEAF